MAQGPKDYSGYAEVGRLLGLVGGPSLAGTGDSNCPVYHFISGSPLPTLQMVPRGILPSSLIKVDQERDYAYDSDKFVWSITVDAQRLEQKVRELTQTLQEDNGSKWMTSELRSHVIQYQLEKLFPRSVDRIEIERNIENLSNTVKVHFKNGHVVATSTSDFLSSEFVALCSMTYQLPHRSTYNAD
jgi:hypothetical protein